MPAIAHLECSRCHQLLSAETQQTICPACAGSFYVRYDPSAFRRARKPAPEAPPCIARYADVLPDADPVTLGEGWTPMLPSRRYPNLLIKEEANNPSGSLEARGMSVAVTMARHYGLKKLAVASTGNAASALAAYAAAAGIEAHLFLPRDVPMANYVEAVACGTHVTLVDGSITDCERLVAEGAKKQGWFDVSTLKEPFRLEGEKTMGYEIVEQLGWTYPDAVFYPIGTGIIGMWKAFEEMEQLGWVSGRRPKMIAIQASVSAEPNADSLILDIVRESGGTVVDLSDETILASLLDWSRQEGLLLCPEGATATAAYDALLASAFLKRTDRVVLLNTSSSLRYTDVPAEALHLRRPGLKKYPERTPVGGIITPQ